jgi:transcriptional regulator with XRE-family HTH domain
MVENACNFVYNKGSSMLQNPTQATNERFSQLRTALNMTVSDFAGALCVSRSYIYELEKGGRQVNERLVKLAALCFGASERWLNSGEGTMFAETDALRQKILRLFDQLKPEYQEYVLRHIDFLLNEQAKEN